MKPWSEQYKPLKTAELAVRPEDLAQLQDVIKKKGVALIHGPTGAAKTASVYAIAEEGNYELIEMNASDFRGSDEINTTIKGSLEQQSLFQREKIILIDELEGVSGMKDRGGLPAIAKLITNNNYPIVLVAHDAWNQKLSTLRKKSTVIEFKALTTTSIVKVLEHICTEQKINYEKEDLKVIARRVGGDIRAAINDLQIHSCTGTLTLGESGEDHERGKEDNILSALQVVLKSTKLENTMGAYDRIKENDDEVKLWLDENIPKEYNPKELEKAYEMLSKADIFKRRIMRWQYWRYLYYVYFFLGPGVALAKEERKTGYVPYKRSSRLLKVWMTNQRNTKRKDISEKLHTVFHQSKKAVIKEDIPFLKFLARHGKVPEALDLSPEEIEWLKK